MAAKVMKISGNPNVFAEAKARKKGGKACGPMGGLAKARMDKPRRARGGKVGADKNPFSSAHKGS